MGVMTGSSPSRGLGAVAAATAAVFVAGKRAGSAVLVDERRLLPAGHVLPRAEASAGVPSPPIEVVFPVAPIGELTPRIPAQLVVLDVAAASVDVGMLDLVLDAKSPGWLPAAVPLSPQRRLPSRVSVFGFPLEEKALNGVWREFDMRGPAADGTVQLRWADDAGTRRGHSGGPVIDPVTGVLVGVLV
jgi:Trypsin-like peptidase domain